MNRVTESCPRLQFFEPPQDQTKIGIFLGRFFFEIDVLYVFSMCVVGRERMSQIGQIFYLHPATA
jgi:hypothetical protein